MNETSKVDIFTAIEPSIIFVRGPDFLSARILPLRYGFRHGATSRIYFIFRANGCHFFTIDSFCENYSSKPLYRNGFTLFPHINSVHPNRSHIYAVFLLNSVLKNENKFMCIMIITHTSFDLWYWSISVRWVRWALHMCMCVCEKMIGHFLSYFIKLHWSSAIGFQQRQNV